MSLGYEKCAFNLQQLIPKDADGAIPPTTPKSRATLTNAMPKSRATTTTAVNSPFSFPFLLMRVWVTWVLWACRSSCRFTALWLNLLSIMNPTRCLGIVNELLLWIQRNEFKNFQETEREREARNVFVGRLIGMFLTSLYTSKRQLPGGYTEYVYT